MADAAHVFRRHEVGWLSVEVIGSDARLRLESLGGIEVPLTELSETCCLRL